MRIAAKPAIASFVRLQNLLLQSPGGGTDAWNRELYNHWQMNYLEQFRDIETFIFDVDGVLTDGQVLVMEDGSLLRRMSLRDGYAIKQAVKEGYNVCIITGSKSDT